MTHITESLALKLPLFQAPLACYPNQERLVAEVSKNGALGVYSSTLQLIRDIEKSIDSIQKATKKPFAVAIDMTAGESALEQAEWSNANKFLANARSELSIEAKSTPTLPRAQEIIALVIDKRPAAIIFENGLPTHEVVQRCRENDIAVMAIVGNMLEAIVADAVVDVLILQGCESAGVHSRFPNDISTPAFPSTTLLQHALANTTKPLVVWGDAQFPQHVVSALVNGASYVMLDSLFWTAQESPIPPSYRNALLTQHNEMQTTISNVWLGHPSQVLQNKFTKATKHHGSILPAKKQQQIMYPVIQAAIAQDKADYMPLWAGLCAVTTEKSVAELCEKFLQELNEIIT